MSGRSAYVRKKNVNTGEHHQHQYQQPQSRPGTKHSYVESDPYDAFSSVSTITSRQRSHSNHTKSGTSVSSWSSHDGRSRRPQLAPLATSGIEKSSFRAFMDSKSEAIRSKLSFKHSHKMGDHQMFPENDNYHFGPNSPPARSAAQPSFELPAESCSATTPTRPRMPRADSALNLNSYDHGLAQAEQAAPVKQWIGGGKRPQLWNKLRKDPELWDPTGDTLVYFSHDGPAMARASPSLRVHSSVLEDTGSNFLITILREGYTYNTTFNYPASPNSVGSDGGRDMQSRAGFSGIESPFPNRQPKMPSAINSLNPRGAQPTPPLSESGQDREHPVMHEIYLPTTSHASRVDILRHHTTTRNVFAFLQNKSLVGLNLYQALLDLQERLQAYMPSDADNTSSIINYIVARGIDDVRNDPASAAGLLAWSEGPSVRWHEGWREAFIHGAGMYNRLCTLPEFRDISHFSRVLLERASLEMQVRVQQAEDKLVDFDLFEMWPMQSVLPPPARSSFDRFQKFIKRFYEAVYWSWPPPSRQQGSDTWLTREMITRLQRDLGCLYDYLVDRDKTWEEPEPHSDRKWKIVSKGNRAAFRADSDDLAITDLLLGFDNRYKYPHIPHPFPLLPTSSPIQYQTKQSLFGPKKYKTTDLKVSERRTALAYSEATNIFVLGTDFANNELVEAFSRFERTDQAGEIDPLDARKGRWILLYGLLQVLATVSADTPKIRYKDSVPYFLNPRLRGTPPWRTKIEGRDVEEASQLVSHCWQVPRQWRDHDHSLERSGLRNHREIVLKSGGYGDGSRRGSPEEGVTPSSEDPSLPPSASPYSSSSQRALQWVASGGFQGGSTPGQSRQRLRSQSRGSERERVGMDWPIQTPLAPRPRELGMSDFVAPKGW
ncbi:MAG: hypothetical protein M1833_000430 [Piccolia ochrophora]|nr:MAG: hypothetical protein M1833_000430 [Piccolia ochrophora]